MADRRMTSSGATLLLAAAVLFPIPGCGMIKSGLALLVPGPRPAPVPVTASRTVYVNRPEGNDQVGTAARSAPTAPPVFEVDTVTAIPPDAPTESRPADARLASVVVEPEEVVEETARPETGTLELGAMSGGIDAALAQLEAIVEQSLAMRNAMLRARVGTP